MCQSNGADSRICRDCAGAALKQIPGPGSGAEGAGRRCFWGLAKAAVVTQSGPLAYGRHLWGNDGRVLRSLLVPVDSVAADGPLGSGSGAKASPFKVGGALKLTKLVTLLPHPEPSARTFRYPLRPALHAWVTNMGPTVTR